MLWINCFLCNSLIVYITIYHWLKYAFNLKKKFADILSSRISILKKYIKLYYVLFPQIKQQEIFLCGNVNGWSIIYLHVYVKFLISFFNSGFWMRLFGNRGLYWCTDVCLYWTARGRHLWVRKRQLTNLSKFRISLYSFLW